MTGHGIEVSFVAHTVAVAVASVPVVSPQGARVSVDADRARHARFRLRVQRLFDPLDSKAPVALGRAVQPLSHPQNGPELPDGPQRIPCGAVHGHRGSG